MCLHWKSCADYDSSFENPLYILTTPERFSSDANESSVDFHTEILLAFHMLSLRIHSRQSNIQSFVSFFKEQPNLRHSRSTPLSSQKRFWKFVNNRCRHFKQGPGLGIDRIAILTGGNISREQCPWGAVVSGYSQGRMVIHFVVLRRLATLRNRCLHCREFVDIRRRG